MDRSIFPNVGTWHFSATLHGKKALVLSMIQKSAGQKNRLSNMMFCCSDNHAYMCVYINVYILHSDIFIYKTSITEKV